MSSKCPVLMTFMLCLVVYMCMRGRFNEAQMYEQMVLRTKERKQ